MCRKYIRKTKCQPDFWWLNRLDSTVEILLRREKETY